MQNPTVMVIHIPKAAGTTLRVVMERQYCREDIWKIGSDIVGDQERLRELSEEGKRKIRVVFGHYCYGLHEGLLQRCDYVTVLRDPVQRLISLYSYAKYGSKAHYLWEAAQRMPFEKFVTSGITLVADNAQVRQLCGQDRFTMVDGKQIPGNDMAIPFGEVTEEHLEAAKRNLDLFACVGIAGEFDRFLACMQRGFGWRVGYYENRNVTRKKPKVSDESLDIVRKRSILDYELYRYARRLALGERE